MKKLIFLMVVVSALSLQLFANRPISGSSTFPKNHKNGSDWLDGNLYPLYLEGSTKDALLALLNKMKADPKLKIVFQFFYQKNDVLTLAVYTGSKDGQNYDQVIDFKLKPYKHCVIINMDKLDVGAYLGAMEIDQGANLDKLIDIVTKNKIIVFMPEKYPVPPTKKIAIMYEICTADTESGICTSDQGKAKTGVTTNPSPPHGGN
jgi:hypothetical protein